MTEKTMTKGEREELKRLARERPSVDELMPALTMGDLQGPERPSLGMGDGEWFT